MSSTIKQAIEALKSRVADAYTAIVAKGGTLPATQDSANLPTAIASIPSGSVEPDDNDVRFWNYQGTLLYAYSKEEVLANDFSMPPYNVQHDNLSFNGWCYTLEELKAYVREYGMCDVGAYMYTTDGSLTVIVNVTEEVGRTIKPGFLYNGYTPSEKSNYVIDWGDGTIEAYADDVSHTYATDNIFTIKVKQVEAQDVFAVCMGGRVGYAWQKYNYAFSISVLKIYLPRNTFLYHTSRAMIFQDGRCRLINLHEIANPCEAVTSIIYSKVRIAIGLETLNNGFFDCPNQVRACCKSTSSWWRGAGIYDRYIGSISDGGSVGALNSASFLRVIVTSNYCGGQLTNCAALYWVEHRGDIVNIPYAFASYELVYISFLNCTSVPTLANSTAFSKPVSGTYGDKGNTLKIIVPKDLYTQWIEATNWATYASYIYYIDNNGDYSQVTP